MKFIKANNAGCSSNVGFLNSGMQRLNLEPGDFCFRIGTIIHEFLHTLGFYHMHSATERDDYVTIMWENILPGTEGNFNTYGPDRITNFGVDYDILSVMHYNAYSATRNGFATIVPHVSVVIRKVVIIPAFLLFALYDVFSRTYL